MSDPELPPDGPRERRTAVLLFVATLCCVFYVYGSQWAGGDPLGDAAVAWESLQFAGTLMAILLAHEMGHYLVARRHGFRLSLPYFLPVPVGFGTFGAIIRLQSLPRSRTALLEMGAAGPLAGFAVALVALALGLPDTVSHAMPLIPVVATPLEPGLIERGLGQLITWWPALGELLAGDATAGVTLLILANPPVMDLLGLLLLGAAPGRYDSLGPVALAGWVGCLLTAINLVPIGQLDGGHVLNALWPRGARLVARVGVGLALLGGLLWPGWLVWGLLLLGLRAWVSLPVPESPPLTRRARVIAGLIAATFLLTFMPLPLEVETLSLWEVQLVGPDGAPLEPPPHPSDSFDVRGGGDPAAGAVHGEEQP